MTEPINWNEVERGDTVGPERMTKEQIDYYRVRDGYLQRLVRDYRGGKRIMPETDDVPETAWIHSCEPDKCSQYSAE